MRQAILDNTVLKVLSLQSLATMIAMLLVLVIGGKNAAVSVLMGGVAVLAGNLAYAFLARASVLYAKPGKVVLLRHVLAEIAKIVIVLALVFGALASGGFAPGWVVAGMAVALMCQWLVWLLQK